VIGPAPGFFALSRLVGETGVQFCRKRPKSERWSELPSKKPVKFFEGLLYAAAAVTRLRPALFES